VRFVLLFDASTGVFFSSSTRCVFLVLAANRYLRACFFRIQSYMKSKSKLSRTNNSLNIEITC